MANVLFGGNGRPSLGGRKGGMAMYDDGEDFDVVPLNPMEEEEEENQEKERLKVIKSNSVNQFIKLRIKASL